MRYFLLIATVMSGFAAAQPAQAIGCLSGGAAGALAGHMAGHGVLGAIGGCIAGRHFHNQRMRRQDFEDRQSYETRRRSYDPDYRSPYN